MTENVPEEIQPTVPSTEGRSNKVTITAIIATVIVILACLAACTTVTFVFLINAPWKTAF